MKAEVKRIKELIKLIDKEFKKLPRLKKKEEITFKEPVFKHMLELGKLQSKINRYFCMTCSTELVHYKDKKTGKIDKYSWVCPNHQDIIMSIG